MLFTSLILKSILRVEKKREEHLFILSQVRIYEVVSGWLKKNEKDVVNNYGQRKERLVVEKTNRSAP